MSNTRSKKDKKSGDGKRKREERGTTLQDGGADKLRRWIKELERTINERDLTILELINEKETIRKKVAELHYQNIDYVRQIQSLMDENMRLSLENHRLMQISQTNSGGTRDQQSQSLMSVGEHELLESLLQLPSDLPKDKKAQEEIEKIMQELQGGNGVTNNSSGTRRDIEPIFPLSVSSLQTIGSGAVQGFMQLPQAFFYPAASHHDGRAAVSINGNALRNRTTISNEQQQGLQYFSPGSKTNPNTFYGRPQPQRLVGGPQQEKQNSEATGFIRHKK